MEELHEKSGVEAIADTFSGDETHQTADNGKRKERKGSSSDQNDSGEDDSDHVQKKRRLIWTSEMHQKFLDAIAQIGHDRAFPKKIVEVMNVPGLTRENVASHLQKYRICLKKVKEGMDKYYYQGSNTETIGIKAPYTYDSSLRTFQQQFLGSSQLASRNFLSKSSSSHSSIYGLGTAIGTSRVRLAPPSYSSFDVSSLRINTGNMPYQYNQMTEVNKNIGAYSDDKRNMLLSILNTRPTSNTPDNYATSSSTNNSAFIGLRIASDGKSLFLGGSDRSKPISTGNYSAKRNDVSFQESALPLPCSNIENYFQDSSLPPLPGSNTEDHFGESSLPSLPEFHVENSWQQLETGENEHISWQQLKTNTEDDLINFIPQNDTYVGTNETEDRHTDTDLEQQNCLQSLPWEILENADLEMIMKILSNNQTVSSLPSLSAPSYPNSNMTSYPLNNNLSNQENSLPPLPSDIPWNLYPDSTPSNHIARVMNQQSLVAPLSSEGRWNVTSDVSTMSPSNNILDHQNLLPSLPSEIYWNLDSDYVPPTYNIMSPLLSETREGDVQQLPLLSENMVNQVIAQPINTFLSDYNSFAFEGDIKNLEEGIGDSSPGLFNFGGFHDPLFND